MLLFTLIKIGSYLFLMLVIGCFFGLFTSVIQNLEKKIVDFGKKVKDKKSE